MRDDLYERGDSSRVEAGETFAFVAVILDCTSDRAKSFYQHWDFEPLPGHPYRLFLSAERLKAMMEA